MKKFTKFYAARPAFSLFLMALVFLSSCSTPKQYFSFTPAPPAYVKKPVAPAVVVTPAKTVPPQETVQTKTDSPTLTASANPGQNVVLPEVAALKEINTQTTKSAPQVNAKQKLTLTQKVVLHKVQKQVKKLSNTARAAAGPVSNRSAIALILIGVVLAVFATLIAGNLGYLFYVLGVLALLIGLILLILNYIS